MTKPFHAGRSSESGVVAAQFAAYGWTATDKILEAPRGFFSAAGGGYDVKSIAGKLGAPWTFEQPGVSIKPHPSGSLTHPGMTEMLRLIGEHGIKAADVQHVRVGTKSNIDRKSVVWGKSVSVSVDLGGRRFNKNKKNI